jgi:hypothetical protein
MFEDVKYFDNEIPVIRPSFCLYADILGFTNHVQSCKTASESNDLLVKFNAVVSQHKKSWIAPHPAWQYKLFSDCVVYAMPFCDNHAMGEPELGQCIWAITLYQLSMLRAGFILRGAITFGEMHLSNDLCFGKALIEAYRLENSAKYPRIILSNDVRALVDKHMTWYSNPASSPQALELLCDNEDNRYFINYLEMLNYRGDGSDWDMLASHREFIYTNLTQYQDNDDLRPKYEWLRDYHDYFCTSDRIFWTEEWGPPPQGVESLLIHQDRNHVTTGRFKPIAEGDSHVLSLKARW